MTSEDNRDIDVLINELADAKKKEKEWTRYRIHCENELADALGYEGEPGKSETWKFDKYHVTFKKPVSYTVSQKDIDFYKKSPQFPFIQKTVLDLKEYNSLPLELKVLKPRVGKTSITLKEVDNADD